MARTIFAVPRLPEILEAGWMVTLPNRIVCTIIKSTKTNEHEEKMYRLHYRSGTPKGSDFWVPAITCDRLYTRDELQEQGCVLIYE